VNAIFNDSDSFTAASNYWPSTTDVNHLDRAWVVFFTCDCETGGPKSIEFHHVRAVRGGS
jgi:hypothetical protein